MSETTTPAAPLTEDRLPACPANGLPARYYLIFLGSWLPD